MTQITMQLQAERQVSLSLEGWESVENFTLSNTSRGETGSLKNVSLAPDDVVELELADGTRLLVAGEDVERYLGRATSRGGEGGNALRVGPALRITGARMPTGPSRDGLGSWILKSLRVYKAGPTAVLAQALAGTFQDSQLFQGQPGLCRLSTDSWSMAPEKSMAESGQPALLFIHGTASSTEGSFRGLWGQGEKTRTEVDYREELARRYGNRIYAFEHRTLTDSPIANVLALVKCLPMGARLHVVSHSRGGMVGELLGRANRIERDPFTEADIARFLAHAERTGRKGAEADSQRLRELNQAMKDRELQVERFVRVAATARGTTLASGRLDRWASAMLNLIDRGIDLIPGAEVVGTGYSLFKRFLLALVKERTDARVLPGLEAMMPDSPLVALLNAPDVEVAPPLHVLAGDFEGEGLLPWLGDCLSEAFYGGETDLVVNTPSMSGGARRSQGIWLKVLSGPKVHHLSYFRRQESAQPLLEALAGDNKAFEQLAGPSRANIARGGKRTEPRPDAPIVLYLPGIMGSQLAIGGDRIWFNPLNMIAGEMERLKIDAEGVSPDGWMDMSYESFARRLATTHEVRPFAYDWRLSIRVAAERFGRDLDEAMIEAERRKKPLRIVAHSLGGLVARLAMKDRWARFKDIPGSRLIQFGTPNRGSHSIAAVLLGRDSFVQKIERWFDWKHDMREFLDIVHDFPGVLELLPWPGEDGKAMDGRDYFDPALWQEWSKQDHENQGRVPRAAAAGFQPAKGAGDGWIAPEAKALAEARDTVREIAAVTLDPECCLYVAGKSKTPVAVRMANGQVEIGWSNEGDGRVPWKSGIPGNIPVWYVDAAHGNLLDEEEAFDEYLSLLETGSCRLPTSPAGMRGANTIDYVAAPLAVGGLYPSEEEVAAAALGGFPRRRRHKSETLPPTRFQVFHGSLAGTKAPILIGAYANDPLSGSASFLNRHLNGSLARAQALGRYPDHPGEVAIFLQTAPEALPSGAIVVGLGALGELTPGALTRALCHGITEYARKRGEERPAGEKSAVVLELATILVGTGYAGISIEQGVRSLLEALRRAHHGLAQANIQASVESFSLFEEEQSRAIAAATALYNLARDEKYSCMVSYDGRILNANGRYRGCSANQGGAGGWQRVHITRGQPDGLRFTLVTDRARNEVNDEPDQRQAVDGLIRAATTTSMDQPGLSRALFELMVPNGMKEGLADVRGLILGVDAAAAPYPWELMRDESGQYEKEPLSTRIGLVRQLASPYGRGRVPTVSENHALVVGDTQSGFDPLPGAVQEARRVKAELEKRDLKVKLLEQAEGQDVLVELFDGHYRVIHLAAHGTVARDGQGDTGMVLGPDTYLTTAQIHKLRHVPELVFINCCHLGNMEPDSRPRWGELAANLATEFIEMGCKAVIAAGWAVDDAAAEVFATTFWREMLEGCKFGDAVLRARKEAWRRHPATNTWGAYQAYGDERYRMSDSGQDDWQAPDYLHGAQVVCDLEQLAARIGPATEDEKKFYERRVQKIQDAARARFFNDAAVRAGLAACWSNLGHKEKAIEHYRAALTADGDVSLAALEQLANLEIRQGETLAHEAGRRKEGASLMEAGRQRLEGLLKLGETVERLSLLGSFWKRQAGILKKSGGKPAKITQALEQMQAAYLRASELSRQLTGERDYYPSLNVLDGAVLLACRGKPAAFDALKDEFPGWLEECRRNAARRYATDQGFFHAMAELDAARLEAQWAMLNSQAARSLARDEVRASLVANVKALFARLGNAREQESAREQIAWLIAMLAEGVEHLEMAEALKNLRDELARP